MLGLVAGGGGVVGVVELGEDHEGVGVVVVVDDAAPVELLLAQDAELEELAVAGLEDVVVVDGEEVGQRRCHVDLVVVFASFYGAGTDELLDARGGLAGAVVALEVLGLVVQELQVAVVHHVVQLARPDYHVDRLRLEEVERLPVTQVLLLLYPQHYRIEHQLLHATAPRKPASPAHTAKALLRTAAREDTQHGASAALRGTRNSALIKERINSTALFRVRAKHTHEFTVEIGAGYFAELNAEQAILLFERRIKRTAPLTQELKRR